MAEGETLSPSACDCRSEMQQAYQLFGFESAAGSWKWAGTNKSDSFRDGRVDGQDRLRNLDILLQMQETELELGELLLRHRDT